MKLRRKLIAVVTAAFLMVPTAAFANPSFGPGNADGGPNDAQSKCHPPGQTEDVPGCK